MIAALALLVIAGGCRKKPNPNNIAEANNVGVRPVKLYFESANMLLAAESRNVALPENPAAAMPVVVREMMKGPASANLARLFPADTVVRGVYLLPDGTAFVDLGGATLSNGWGTGTHQELMAVYSVVQTMMANFADVKRVRLLVNGEVTETLGGHISLAKSLHPMPSLVDASSH
jgi:spore germination protein GerM